MPERNESIRWILVDLIYDFCGEVQVYRGYSSRATFDPKEDVESLSQSEYVKHQS